MAPTEFYPVYRVKFRLGLQMTGETRYHNAIFVENKPDGKGDKIHITGDITNGFKYEIVDWKKPEESGSYVNKDSLGYVRASDYPALEAICRKQPVPSQPQQRWYGDGIDGYYARCKQDGSFFQEGETIPHLFRCTEWTENYAIPALESSGLLHRTIPTQQPGQQGYQIQQALQSTATQGTSNWAWDEMEQKYKHWNGNEWVFLN